MSASHPLQTFFAYAEIATNGLTGLDIVRPITIGIWIMLLAVLSALATVPMGFGAASGLAFVIGMLIAWIAGIGTTVIAIARWVGSKLKFR